MTKLIGKVKWFNETKGFGFVTHNGQDHFAHAKAIKSGETLLLEGQTVEFTVEPNPKGPQARDIHVIEPDGNI
jgi:CspA family cold shock protein